VAVDAGVACDLIANCVDFFTRKRTDDDCKTYIEEASQLCTQFDLCLEFRPRRRPARTPCRLEGDVMITENIGDRPFTSDLRTELYYPTIDTALAELDRRFSTENIAVLMSVGAFIPGSDRFLDIDVLLPLAEQYKSNVDDLKVKVQQTQRKEADFDKENKLLAFAVFIKQCRDAYYEVSRLIRIACTLPVTSAQAERSFSCLKLIKTHLRTTMLDSRLSNLSLLSLHSGRVNALDLDQVVDMFAVSEISDLSHTAVCISGLRRGCRHVCSEISDLSHTAVCINFKYVLNCF